MSKRIVLFLTIITLGACSSVDSIEGTWKTQSQFYRGTYKIAKEDRNLKGLVLYFNDDTFSYSHQEGKKHYLFENLKKEKNGVYTDGISGATKKSQSSSQKTIELIQVHPDTLRVTINIEVIVV